MEIIDNYYNKRTLIKEDKKEVNISDEETIKYTGFFYEKIITEYNIENIKEIKSTFIGIVETCRGDSSGTTGIYVAPLYMLNQKSCEWNKIANYTKPINKYFLYPHLLMLPDKYYHYKPLYFLHTCENVDINDFANVTTEVYL